MQCVYSESSKRLRKASERTRSWYHQLQKEADALNIPIIGVCQADRLEGIDACVDQLIASGSKGIVAGGAYCDHRMKSNERKEIVQRIKKAANGRLPVITLHSAHYEHQTYMQPTDEEHTVPKLNFKKNTQQQQPAKPKPPPVSQSFIDVSAFFLLC